MAKSKQAPVETLADTGIRIVRGSNGVAYVDCGDWLMAIVIPSRKRIEMLQGNPALPLANVFVHANEANGYAAAPAQPLSLLTHELDRMGRIHNRMFEMAFADERCKAVVRFDDDWGGFVNIFAMAFKTRKDVNTIASVLWNAAVQTLDAPAGQFGFYPAMSPLLRSTLQPFVLRDVPPGSTMGVVDRDLRCHPDLTEWEDVDMGLSGLRKWKIAWMDYRWAQVDRGGGMGTVAGGMSGTRDNDKHDDVLRFMEERWPGVIVPQWGDRMPSGMTREKLVIPK